MTDFNNDKYYQDKYLKYKNKYLTLKNENLNGGFNWYNPFSSSKKDDSVVKEMTNYLNSLNIKECQNILNTYIENANNEKISTFVGIIKKLNEDIKKIISSLDLEFYKLSIYYDKNKIYDKDENKKKINSIIQELNISELLPFIKEKVKKLMPLLKECEKNNCDIKTVTDTINEIEIYGLVINEEMEKLISNTKK